MRGGLGGGRASLRYARVCVWGAALGSLMGPPPLNALRTQGPPHSGQAGVLQQLDEQRQAVECTHLRPLWGMKWRL